MGELRVDGGGARIYAVSLLILANGSATVCVKGGRDLQLPQQLHFQSTMNTKAHCPT